MKHLKQEFDKLTFKEALIFAITILSMIAGLVLLFLGMYIHPEGEIHESVLTAFGIICVFTASLLGISIHYGNELLKLKDTINTRLSGIVAETGLVYNGNASVHTFNPEAARKSTDTPHLSEQHAEEGVPV